MNLSDERQRLPTRGRQNRVQFAGEQVGNVHGCGGENTA